MNNESTGSSSDSTAPQLTRRENSPDHSIRADGPVAQGGDATIHDRTGLYLAIIAALFAAIAFGFAIGMPMVYEARMDALKDRVNLAERQAALAREDVRIMRDAMNRRGIEVDEHAEENK